MFFSPSRADLSSILRDQYLNNRRGQTSRFRYAVLLASMFKILKLPFLKLPFPSLQTPATQANLNQQRPPLTESGLPVALARY